MMKMFLSGPVHVLVALVLAASFHLSSTVSETCDTNPGKRNDDEDCGGHEESKYSKSMNAPDSSDKWNGYLREIERAEASYVECHNIPESCSCYKHLIDGDLEPFHEIK